MAEGIQIRVHPKLVKVLSDIQEEVEKKVKDIYPFVKGIKVQGTVASEILAAYYQKQKQIPFSIKKKNSEEGLIKIL